MCQQCLSKAIKLQKEGKVVSLKEESPYLSVRQYLKRVTEKYDRRLYSAYKAICKTWMRVSPLEKGEDDLPFKLNGKVFISPKSGKSLTKKEWKLIEKDLQKLMSWAFEDSEEILVNKAIAMGKILAVMSADSAKETSLSSLEDQIDNEYLKEAYLQNQIAFAESSAAEYISSIEDSLRKDIKLSIIRALQMKEPSSRLQHVLFDSFADANRDWRMIAETEINNNLNNAVMLTELERSKAEGRDYSFVMGVSNANACPFCRDNVNGKIFALVAEPLKDDQLEIDGDVYTAIWPGKSNYGRVRKNWWVASGVQHPHCYDDQTEVLTDSGWKFFKDLGKKDKIMSIDPNSQEVGFVSFNNFVSYLYEGDMICFKGRNYDLVVTPDHNMLFTTLRDLKKGKGFREASATDLYSRNSNYQLPRAVGVYMGMVAQEIISLCTKLAIDLVDFVKLTAWFLAEGSIQRLTYNMQLGITQKNPLDVFYDLPSIQKYCRLGKMCVWIFNKDICNWFSEFVGVKSFNKYIPASIKTLPSSLLRVFIETYIKGDGSNYRYRGDKSFSKYSKNRQVLYTSSQVMMSDLSEIIVKAGWMPSFALQRSKGKAFNFPNGTYTCKHDVFVINVCTSSFKYITPFNRPFKKRYKGFVYDVTLSKWHHLLVRRNGKVAWSGNCACAFIPL